MTSAPDIEIHIDELVLHGIDPADRHAVGEALERALGRLLAERGWPGGGLEPTHVAAIDAGELALAPGAGPEAIGAGVAGAVLRALPASRAAVPTHAPRASKEAP